MAWIATLIVYAFLPSFMLWVCWPPRMKRLGRNAWVGIRTATTTHSEEAWTSAHRAAWKPMVWSSVAMYAVLLAAVPVVRQGTPSSTQTETAVTAGTIGLSIYGVGVVIAAVVAQRAAKRAIAFES